MGFSSGMAMQGFGTGMAATGAYNEGRAQQATMGYEAGVARNNAAMAEYQASQAQVVGAEQEQISRLKSAQVMGSTRATLAANGVDLGEGNANEIIAGNKEMGEMDALTIRDNAARTAWAYRMQGQNYNAEAAADTAMGRSINPGMMATGSLMSGAAGIASSWKRYQWATQGTGNFQLDSFQPGDAIG